MTADQEAATAAERGLPTGTEDRVRAFAAPDSAPAGPTAALGCRVDLVRLSGQSVLERYWLRHLDAARRSGRAAQARSNVLQAVEAALADCLPVVPDPSVPAGRGDADHADDADDARDGFEAGLDAELRVLEAVERAKAVLDGHALTALARMRSSAQALVAAGPVSARAVPVEPDELVTLEVATATGLGQREVGVRLELATGSVSRFGRLRQLLAAGSVSLRRACQLVEETRHLLDDRLVEQVVGSVFAPTRDGAGLSGGLFRQRLRRAVLRADTDAAAGAARRRAARRRNGAFAQLFDDGTGALTVRNDADKIAAAMDRADAAARAAKAAGDPRSLDQLRADFITGAVIYGQPPHPGPRPGAGEPAQAGANSTGGHADPAGHGAAPADAGTQADPQRHDTPDPTGAEPGTAAPTAPGCGPVPHWWACFGARPPGRVWIVVPVSTVLGVDDAPAQLPGHGWVAAQQARAMITAPGSIWQTMAAETDTGRALRLSRPGYRPSRAMIEHVIAVDGTCRGPGCTVPATQCDLDHDIPYPHGPTDTDHLSSKHRQHHRIRTAGHWNATRDPHDASITWRTAAGRTYTTYPTDWLHDARPTHQPDADPTTDPDPPPF